MREQITVGPASVRVGVQPHHLVRLANRGQIPFTRAGRIRLLEVKDLELIRRVCEEVGYCSRTEVIDSAS